jgi:hypothetical protein
VMKVTQPRLQHKQKDRPKAVSALTSLPRRPPQANHLGLVDPEHLRSP